MLIVILLWVIFYYNYSYWELINIKNEKKVIRISFFTFILYLLIMSLLEVFLYTVIGIGLLSFLGFQYTSYFSVIIFLIICYIMLILTDYCSTFLISLLKIKSKLTKFQERCIDFIMYVCFSTIVIGLVDYLSSNIDISSANQVLFIVMCYLFDICSEYFIMKKD
ncbi:YrvL family regulatory protein [Terrisporobacter sp.]|uniref:YrvL family regulatory protein n=1 Tax=Terrisporobacter sp. TaxID=1965305 RepID=UPI003FCE4E4C